MIKITKKQEYVDDVPGETFYVIRKFISDENLLLASLIINHEELLELKEAINNLDIK